jgi:hypothetical protein
MRRVHITQFLRKQMESLRDVRENVCRGGVMVIPRMKSVAEFDAIAPAMQAQLAADVRNEPVTAPIQPLPIDDVSHRYRPDSARLPAALISALTKRGAT